MANITNGYMSIICSLKKTTYEQAGKIVFGFVFEFAVSPLDAQPTFLKD
jgi:hypothetical protein